jgi:DNA-binding MurR/RpiR family transcriptional regulator
MTEGTTVRIKSLMPVLSNAEKRVAQRVLDAPGSAAASTITTLALDCDTSEATVVRFCRAVGFMGFRALRLALATEVGRAEGGAGSARTVSGDIRPGDDLDQVVEKIAFADARAVEETAQQLDLDALRLVIEAIVAARRIDIYGVGASAFVGLDLQQKLHRIGLVSFAWIDPHVALTSAALLGRRDVAVGISHSGADLVLTTAARETTFRSGATASRLAQLTVVDCMFVGVAQRTYESSQHALEVTYDAAKRRRMKTR